jgi:hypothetical protein
MPPLIVVVFVFVAPVGVSAYVPVRLVDPHAVLEYAPEELNW